MKKYRGLYLLAGVILLINSTACKQMNAELLASKTLQHFPSASAIEYHGNKIYVIGDDARYLLILDKNYHATDSITLFNNTEKRIPKQVKADLESATIITENNTQYLLVSGSGATEAREKIFQFPLSDLTAFTAYNPVHFFAQLKQSGIAEINIEGAATVNNSIVLSNRSNLTNKTNQLIVTSTDFFKNSAPPIHLIDVHIPGHAAAGLSGLAYVPALDLLLFTASDDQTTNPYSDGMISNSYISIIIKFSS